MKHKVKIIGDYGLINLELKVNEFLENLDLNQIDEIQYSTVIDGNGCFFASCLISYFSNNGRD